MSDRSATVTVDLGGTQMRAAIVAPDGEPLLPRSEPTPGAAACPDALMDLASRSVITQSARVLLLIPILRATSTRGQPEVFTNSTTPARNSGGYCDRGPNPGSPPWSPISIECPPNGASSGRRW